MRIPRPVLLVATLLTASAAGALLLARGRGAEAARAPVHVAAPVPDADPFEAAPAAAGRAHEGLAAASTVTATTERLSARVDRLARSTDPVDVFAAYRLVTACLWARDHEDWLLNHIAPGDRANLPTTQTACGDIASDQVQSRLRWLEVAAAAGVHHAATAMVREGPDGLGLVPEADRDAPQYADWRGRLDAAWEAGVRTCDPESLEHRVNVYETGSGVPPDRARALSYWVAYVDCRKHFDGAPSAVIADGDGVAQRLGSALGADQVSAAVAAGHALARDARPLPGDS